MFIKNSSIKYRFLISILLLNLCIGFSQNEQVKVLIGGTLIDGFGSDPIKNSVVIIEGQRIKEVGTIGNIDIPANAEIISTEGMTP